MKLDHLRTPYTKIQDGFTHDLNMRPETIEILEGNTGNTSLRLAGSNFLGRSPEAGETKAKKKSDFKVKGFCTKQTELKGNLWAGRRYLQVTDLMVKSSCKFIFIDFKAQ